MSPKTRVRFFIALLLMHERRCDQGEKNTALTCWTSMSVKNISLDGRMN